MNTTRTPEQLNRLARRRASAKMGWYLHATVYVIVNLFLAAIALYQGRHWYAFPLLGWGLGLALHGAAVWLVGPSAGLRQRMVERERAVLERQS